MWIMRTHSDDNVHRICSSLIASDLCLCLCLCPAHYCHLCPSCPQSFVYLLLPSFSSQNTSTSTIPFQCRFVPQEIDHHISYAHTRRQLSSVQLEMCLHLWWSHICHDVNSSVIINHFLALTTRTSSLKSPTSSGSEVNHSLVGFIGFNSSSRSPRNRLVVEGSL